MIDSLFNEALMLATAKRIAKTTQTDPVAAKADFDQHVRDMSADEAADFEKAIIRFAIELGS